MAQNSPQRSEGEAHGASVSLQEGSRGSVCMLCGFQAEGRRRLGAHIRSAHSLAPEAQIRRMDFRRCGVGGCMAIIATAPNSLNQHLQTGNHCPVGDAHPAVPIRPADESVRISTASRGLDRGWDWVATLSVDACFVNRVGSLTEVPRRCWGDFNRCAIVALERLERDPLDLHAWKFHSLLSTACN